MSHIAEKRELAESFSFVSFYVSVPLFLCLPVALSVLLLVSVDVHCAVDNNNDNMLFSGERRLGMSHSDDDRRIRADIN